MCLAIEMYLLAVSPWARIHGKQVFLSLKISRIISSLGCFSRHTHTENPYAQHLHTHTHKSSPRLEILIWLWFVLQSYVSLPQTQSIDFPWMRLNMVAAALRTLLKTTALAGFFSRRGSQEEALSIGRAELWSRAQFLECKWCWEVGRFSHQGVIECKNTHRECVPQE